MKAKLLIISMLCLAVAAIPATAQTVSYNLDNSPMFTFEMPEGWKFQSKPSQRDPGVRRISGTAPEGLVWFGVWAVKSAKTIAEAEAYVKATAKSMITDSKEKKAPYDGDLNGLKARYYEVTGTMKMQDGKTEKFDARAAIFEVAPGKVGLAVCMADLEGMQRENAKIDAFFKSIKGIR